MLAGRTGEAVAAFEGALALDGSLEEARLNRAVAHLRLGDPARAATDLEAIWKNESSPYHARAAYHLALATARLGRTGEAGRWIERAVSLDPSLDAARLYGGFLREQSGDLEGAARLYLDYLKLHPASTAAMLRLALSAQKAGRGDVAKLYLNRVLTTAPASPEAVQARKYLVLWE